MINPPMNVPPIMLTGLDLIIIQARLHVNGKTARKITEVAEIAGMEGSKPRLNTIWKYNAATDQIEETGIPSNLREVICRAAGVTPDVFEKHVNQRQQIIEDLVARGISDIQSVTTVVQNFYAQNNH
jgi:flagellar protein FlaI